MKGQTSQLLAILILILLFVGGFFIVEPLRKDVSAKKAEVSERAETLQTLQSEYDELQALADEASVSEAKKDQLLKAVPVGKDQDGLILELTGLTQELGFGVNAINFALTSGTGQNSILVTAVFTGTYEDLIDFLQKLENADRLFQVKSISVQLTSTTDVVFNLNIEAYYQ
ncbi:type 4a pilus biogenesis protein PilO [Patescibacteria group bacterium]|nr:type 4a pilus biogenesis protein PilO [Patescibacteria group bacterium]